MQVNEPLPDWVRERNNFNSVDLRTQFSATDKNMEHWAGYFSQELKNTADLSDPQSVQRRETALQAIVELDNARNFGVGAGNVAVNTQLNDPEVKLAKDKALEDLGKKLDLINPGTHAINTRPTNSTTR